VIWWFVTLLPCLDYRQLTFPLVEDQFSYLPSVGLCLALGYLLLVTAASSFPNLRAVRLLAPALTVVAVLWASQVVRCIPHWRSNDSLFQYGLRDSPNVAYVRAYRAGIMQFIEHDNAGATRELQAALQLNERGFVRYTAITYNAYIELGEINLSQGHVAEALEYFNKAVRLQPNAHEAYDELGSVYFPRGDYAQAAEYFQKAVQAKPLDVVARFFLGTCWIKLGKPQEAAEQFRQAREAEPDYLQAYEAEARAWEAAGNRAQAAAVRALLK